MSAAVAWCTGEMMETCSEVFVGSVRHGEAGSHNHKAGGKALRRSGGPGGSASWFCRGRGSPQGKRLPAGGKALRRSGGPGGSASWLTPVA
eukprot:scaffold2930_cov75-Phaeocystis_antarctica.AAC.1